MWRGKHQGNHLVESISLEKNSEPCLRVLLRSKSRMKQRTILSHSKKFTLLIFSSSAPSGSPAILDIVFGTNYAKVTIKVSSCKFSKNTPMMILEKMMIIIATIVLSMG